MTKQEFIQIIVPVSEYYGRAMTEAAIKVYYQVAKDIDAPAFEHLINLHIADPDQGMFFPTLSHLSAQASCEADIKRQASIEFEANPSIDGTIPFDVKAEKKEHREARKRNFVSKQLDEWKGRTAIERIAYSDRVPDQLKVGMLMKLSAEVINKLDHKKSA